MYRLVVFIFCSLLLTQSSILGKEKIVEGITIDSEMRFRYEFDNRDFSNSTGADGYGSLRTRIGIEFDDIIENTIVAFRIIDSRMLGFSNPYLNGKTVGPNGFDNNLGVSEAFIEIREVLGGSTKLTLGRMANYHGRYTILGPGNWSIFGPRTFDGLKFRYSDRNVTTNFWTFYGSAGDRYWYPVPGNPRKYPDTSTNFKKDHYLVGFDASVCKEQVNLLYFTDLDQNLIADTTANTKNIAFQRHTTAINIKWRQHKETGIGIDLDGAYQFGNIGLISGKSEINAYMLAGEFL